MKNFFLINNKSDEPTFKDSCARVVEKHGFTFQELAIANISSVLDKDSDTAVIYNGTEPIQTTPEDRFYVRTRKPIAQATALLQLVLDSQKLVINEPEASLEHTIRESKMAQPFLLKPAGIRFPTTFVSVVENVPRVQSVIDSHISYPRVVKLTGSKGEKVWKCDTAVEFESLFSELRDEGNKLIKIQEYIPNKFDIRVIVHFNRIIGGVARSASDGFYNNISKGGTAAKIELTAEEEHIALEAARLTKLELAGIDIVRTESGPLLFEVNKSPDITAFCEASGIDLVSLLIEEFIEKN